MRGNASRGGFSLLEVVLALALTATLVGAMVSMGGSSTRLVETGLTRAQLEAQIARTLQRVARDLSCARAGSFDPLPETPLWQDAFDFDEPRGFRAADGRITWSSARIVLELEDGEVDDGVDNNGNGLVDERRLVALRDAGGPDEQRVVLTRWVREYLEGEEGNGLDDDGNGLTDERGFCMERRGEELVLHLTLEILDREGRVVTRSLETSVWPRN